MTPLSASRPVLVCLLALGLNACSGIENDPHRFETMARAVAAIDVPLVPGGVSRDAPVLNAEQTGLRPALQVQVMDPHDLWDARDAGLRGAVTQVAAQVATEAAPAVADAVVRRVSEQVQTAAPALRPATTAIRRTTIQLGAFSSEAAARAAWADVNQGPARSALKGLSPVFEGVQVNGRPFTRLKVGPIPVEAAAGLCRAAQIADPWCRRAA